MMNTKNYTIEIESMKEQLHTLLEDNKKKNGCTKAKSSVNQLLWLILVGTILLVVLTVVSIGIKNQAPFPAIFSFANGSITIVELMIIVTLIIAVIVAISLLACGLKTAIQCHKVDCNIGIAAGILCALPLGITQLIGLILCFVAKTNLRN